MPVVNTDSALGLIERIYDTVLDSAQLPAVLVEIGRAAGGCEECFLAQGPDERAFTVVAPRRDPAYISSLRDSWPFRSDPGFPMLVEGLMAAPLGRTQELGRVMDMQRLAATAFYNDWWRAQGLGPSALIVRFAAGNGGWGIVGIHGSRRGNEAFTGEQTALLDTLAPHLTRALCVQHELACLTFERQTRAVLPQVADKGIFLLAADGRVVFANAHAENRVNRDGGFRLRNGRLTMTESRNADALERVIADCIDPTSERSGGSLTLRCGRRPRPTRVVAAPVRCDTAEGELGWLKLFQPAAVLVIWEQEGDRRAQRKLELQRRFGLTPAEADIALEILRGDGRKAAAARMGISPATVRAHLHGIFDKTGVRRQTELVRLLLSKPADRNEG
jgi:DNA-binding CsgD family transcriptional regulator